MKLNINEIENMTFIQNCSCCDVDINCYKVKFECLLELDLEILASSEQEAKESFHEVLNLIDVDELVENEDMHYIYSKKLTLN